MPKPGELNQRIRIVAPVSHINENGYAETVDEEICEVWAQAITSGDATYEEAGTTVAAGAMNFTIRYRSDVREGMGVVFNGKRYEITALSEFDFKKRFLGMKTIAGEAVSI